MKRRYEPGSAATDIGQLRKQRTSSHRDNPLIHDLVWRHHFRAGDRIGIVISQLLAVNRRVAKGALPCLPCRSVIDGPAIFEVLL